MLIADLEVRRASELRDRGRRAIRVSMDRSRAIRRTC